MAARVVLLAMTPAEQQALTTFVQSRIASVRDVERARIVLTAAEDRLAPDIGAGLGCSRSTVHAWIRRFNDSGLDGLKEGRRPGRPPTYTAEQRAGVIAAALTDPQSLGLPFASWTMDGLRVYLNEEKALAMRRSRIGEILVEEGLRWRKQETWFGERVDPDFAEERGRSTGFAPPHPRAR